MPDSQVLINNDELMPEKNRLLYQSTYLSIIGVLINVLILAVVQSNVIAVTAIVLWSALMIATLIIRYTCYRLYKSQYQLKHPSTYWYSLFYMGTMLTATVWGLAVFLIFPDENVVYQVFVAFIFAGVSAGSISSLSYDKKISILYLVIMLLPLSIRFFFTENIVGSMMGLAIIAYLGVLIGSSSRFNRQFIENIKLTKEAEMANKAKSEFLSSMSHDLRTPMNAILSLSKLMLIGTEKNNLSDTHKKNLHEIVHAADHLLSLINEVLDLSKIESNTFEIELRPEGIRSILDECIVLVEPLMLSRSITLKGNYAEHENITVTTDRLKLKQVLLNLLSNAIKYNKEGGIITVDYIQTENELKISITDTGEGLTPEQLGHLFVPFERLGAENKNIEGSGIGLVIVKNLIEKMQGTVGCSSQPGEGSEFWITMPYQEHDDLSARLDNNEPETLPRIEQNTHDQNYTVLYIEDDITNIMIVEQLIGLKGGINLLTAETGSKGLDIINNTSLDLLLLDINLPDMSGLDIVANIKQHDNNQAFPVIALSANAMADDIARGKQAGVDDYLLKPIDFTAFEQMLNRYLYH